MLHKSEHISVKMVQNVFRAFDYAKTVGVPLNVTIVLHLHETDAQAASTIFKRIRHKYRDWLIYACKAAGNVRLPPMYVYSFEAPNNPHVNWALYVPPALLAEFLQKLPGWATKVQGSLGPFDINVERIDMTGYKSLANYMVKGCDPAFIDHFHLRSLYNTHGPQGEFYGQRAGVSPSFNKTARKTAGYDAKRRRILAGFAPLAA